MEDLEAKRIPGYRRASVRFPRDPVRMLRVLRHAARIGSAIDAAASEEGLGPGPPHPHLPPGPGAGRTPEGFPQRRGPALLQTDAGLKAVLCHLPGVGGKAGVLGGEPPAGVDWPADLLVQNGYPLSDSLLWAVFLTAFIEPELRPRNLKDLRELVQEKIKAALGGIETPGPGGTRSPRCWP